MNSNINKKLFSILVSAFLITFEANASSISSSFSKAKKKLYTQVYKNQGLTFYTNCTWSKKKVDLYSCNLENSFEKKHLKRANRIEAEHIIPASWMYKKHGKFRQCYLDAKQQNFSPRKYCRKNDLDYRNAHNDLVNLRPAVGQINGMRSNKPFAEKPSGQKLTTHRGNGKVIQITSRVVTPDPQIRGDIARIAFYMKSKYGVTYSKRQNAIFETWAKQDPISQEEFALNQKIHSVQGSSNSLIKN